MPDNYILEMRGITKVYSNGFVANKNVNLAVREGEIHALVGENGAGKSTLMKVLFGVESHEEGEIYLNGQIANITDPIRAIDLGIGMVHQHFMLVPSLTVAENIVLGREPKKSGVLIDMEKAVLQTKELCEKYNLNVDPVAKVKDLPVGMKQKVEILKALYRKAKVLILDEPTAVLTPQETAELFVELKRMKEAGHTIIFISHKLNEVKELCDRVLISADLNEILELSDSLIVMHGGEIVAYLPDSGAVTENELGEYMLGIKHQTPEEIRRVCYEC